MRSTSAPPGPGAVAPVQSRPDTPARQGTGDSRTFAELLAEAEAVQDHIDIRRRVPMWRGGVQGALQGAAGLLARQGPWMGLPLLLRQPGQRTRREPEQ